MSRWRAAALAAVATILTGAVPASAGVESGPRPAAAGIWEASLEGQHGVSPDVTVRQLARVSVAGSGIRIRLGNVFGAAPVRIRDAWLGRTLAPGVPRLDPGSNHPLTFRGARTVTIPPGGQVFSDPVPITVKAQE